MSNRRFNKQTRKAAMGGGMMKRGMYKKGSFPDMSGDGKITKKDYIDVNQFVTIKKEDFSEFSLIE